MKIYAPVKDANGTWCSVRFTNGVGETNDEHLIDWFIQHGYEVENVEKSEKTDEISIEKSVEVEPDFYSMTPNNLRDWMREHGYGGKIKNIRDKKKLLAILKEG